MIGTDYDEMNAEKFAQIITDGAAKACLKLSGEFNSASSMYAHHNGAEFLHWQYQSSKGEHLLCEKLRTGKDGAYGPVNQYRLTRLGLEVQAILKLKER